MRSRTGCLTCRRRKLKCDEKRPLCGQCRKGSRECIQSSGIVFRHQQNASMNGEASEDDNLMSFFTYKDSFDSGSIWVDIPKQITFLNTTNPYLEPLTSERNLDQESCDDLALPCDRSDSGMGSRSDPSSPYSEDNVHVHGIPTSASPEAVVSTSPYGQAQHGLLESSLPIATPSLDDTLPPGAVADHSITFLLNSPAAPSTPMRPNSSLSLGLSARKSQRRSSASLQVTAGLRNDTEVESDPGLALLLRYFSEGPGHWMDLFDLGTYFSSYVPVKARENPLLKFAAVAYAAKALGRQTKKPLIGGDTEPQALTRLCSEPHSVNWHHQGARYYDMAISLLRRALEDDGTSHGTVSQTDEEQSWEVINTVRHETDSRKRRRTCSTDMSKPTADELLAATAILCVYEFLDASNPEWARHLNGAKSLLQIAKERMMPLQASSPGASLLLPNLAQMSKARKATFWNIVRQDMLAAFINETQTRFDTEDLQLWREAGLLIDNDGSIQPSNASESDYPEGETMMKEDMICNALVWLMAKLVNFMAAGDDMPTELGGPFAAVPQRTLLGYWQYLRQQFHTWFSGLPATFQPSARIEPLRIPAQSSQDSIPFPEVWYSIPMCASTMQSYYMAQIQLLMNKPHESTQGRSTVFARVNSYKLVLAACLRHSREIVSISLAHPNESVRINSTQPLFTAGQCLRDLKERQLIVNLLRDIEIDTGWATGYRVQELTEQWQWEEDEEANKSLS